MPRATSKPPARRLLSATDARRVAERIANRLFGPSAVELRRETASGKAAGRMTFREAIDLIAAELAKETTPTPKRKRPAIKHDPRDLAILGGDPSL